MGTMMNYRWYVIVQFHSDNLIAAILCNDVEAVQACTFNVCSGKLSMMARFVHSGQMNKDDLIKHKVDLVVDSNNNWINIDDYTL